MLRLLLKLAVAGLIANAAWHAGSAYLSFYRFNDAVAETVLYGGQKTTAELERRVIELASQYDIPLDDDAITVQRDDRNHTLVDGSYTQPVEVIPGYRYPWQFTIHIDELPAGPIVPSGR